MAGTCAYTFEGTRRGEETFLLSRISRQLGSARLFFVRRVLLFSPRGTRAEFGPRRVSQTPLCAILAGCFALYAGLSGHWNWFENRANYQIRRIPEGRRRDRRWPFAARSRAFDDGTPYDLCVRFRHGTVLTRDCGREKCVPGLVYLTRVLGGVLLYEFFSREKKKKNG